MTTASIVEPLYDRWKASRFNACVTGSDGAMLIYNSCVGSVARIPRQQVDSVKHAMARGLQSFPVGMFASLAMSGFFVPSFIDEMQLATALHSSQWDREDVMELVLMPTEQCNFRCIYCYESFARGGMERSVIDSIVEHVRKHVKSLSLLRIGWFGGEPLLAAEIIEELSTRMQEICATHGVEYTSSMTTNGYLLTPSVQDMLLRSSVRRFQITLDGPKGEHDRQRVLADHRTGTFDRILHNLTSLRDRKDLFRVSVRVNFSRTSVDEMDGFLELMGQRFGGDGRFSIDFHPVSHMGGPGDSAPGAYDSMEEGGARSLSLARRCTGVGFDALSLRSRLKPFGSACYAANPHSFIVGADGTVYKCTVAFEDPRNRVGTITPEGDLALDSEKLTRWVANGEEQDLKCQSCFFRPACQGNACPLARLNHGRAICPPVVTNMAQALRTIEDEMCGIRAL